LAVSQRGCAFQLPQVDVPSQVRAWAPGVAVSANADDNPDVALGIHQWPIRGLRLEGALAPSDVEHLLDAIVAHPEGGAIALHFEAVTSVDPDAARVLRSRLDELRTPDGARARLYLHVKRGSVFDALVVAGFEERAGEHELILM
jgi:hypothetical protein